MAIENATLYRETRWYAGLLATLYEIGKETASILDLDALLQRLAEIVKRVIDYEMFGILLLDEERQELVLRKAVNFGPAKERSRIAVSEGLCGAAVRSRAPVLVGDVRKDPRYVSLVPETRSELVVPLVHKDRVIGVFDLESPVLDRFTERHVKVLTPLASQVAVAVENARLVAEIRKNEERLARELRIAQDDPAGALPGGLPLGSRAGRPRPTSAPPASSGATSTTSTTWAAASSGSRPGTWRARACPPRSTRPSPPARSGRGPSSGGRRPTSCSG